MNANTSLISRLFPLSFALPSHLLFFIIISHLFFSSSVSSRFPFFSIDMSYVMTTHTRRRTNRTSVIIIHASCFWSIYIYIFFFSFQIDIVNCQFDSYDYHLSPIFQTARRGKKAQKKKRKKERMYLSSEQRMPIVCLLYREGFRCNIDLCFKVCTRLRK